MATSSHARMREKFEEFSEDSDIHGVKRIFSGRNSKARRFMWTLFVVTAFTALTVYVTHRYYKLLDLQTRTVMKTEKKTGGINFPGITFCNKNEFRISKYNKTELSIFKETNFEVKDWLRIRPVTDLPEYEYMQPFKHFMDRTFVKNDSVDQFVSLFANDSAKKEYLKNFDYKIFVREAGHQVEDMFQKCYWKGADKMGSECNTSWFDHTFYYPYGNCYTFRGPEHMRPLKVADDDQGLVVVTNIQSDEYNFILLWHKYLNGMVYNIEPGLVAFLHSNERPPIAAGQKIIVNSNKNVIIVIKDLTTYRSLPAPYTNCSMANNNSMCIAECVSALVRQDIGKVVGNDTNQPCKLCAYYDVLGDIAPEHICKGDPHQNQCMTSWDGQALTQCKDECPPDCVIHEYNYDVEKIDGGMRDWLNIVLMQCMVQNQMDVVICINQVLALKKNLARVIVTIKSDSAKEYSMEEAYGPGDFASDFGGMMGMCLGVSALAIIHLIEFLLDAVYSMIRRKITREIYT